MDIFFDLDGTLIDTSKRNYLVYKSITLKLNSKPLDKSLYWQLKKGRQLLKILKLSQIPKEKHSLFNQQFLKKIEAVRYLSFDSIFPFTIKTLDYLLEMGHNLYLVSYRRFKKRTLQEIARMGLGSKFKGIEIGRVRNSGYESKAEFIKQLRTTKFGIIVGDTEDEVLTAQKLNLISVSVLSGIRSERFLRKLKPNFIIKDIHLLPSLMQNHILR